MSKLVSLLIIIWHFTLFAQDRFSTQIKTNVPILFVAMWNVQFQKQIKEDKALQFSWATIDKHHISGQTQATGNIFTVDFKSYWPRKKRRSIRYLAPFVRYESLIFEGNLDRVRMRHPGCGLMVGKETTILRRVIMDMYLGANYFPGHYKVLATDGYMNIAIPSSLQGLGMRAGFSLGYTF